MKLRFAETITPDTGLFTDVFMIQACSSKKAKNETQYLNLTLRDKTGDVDAKVWNWDGGFLPAPGMILKVECESGAYQGELQLKVLRMRQASEEEISIDDFLPASKRDRDEMRESISRVRIADPIIRNLVLAIIREPNTWRLLRDAPAAKGNHQPYLGGLLEHIINLLALAQAMSIIYTDLDADLLFAAAVLHDIGKVYELDFARSIDYSRRGKLVGHVVIGLQMFHDALEQVSNAQEKLDHLEHIICSHHGRKEWGAPQTPMSREAVLFHQLDMIDSRMGSFDEMVDEKVDALGFTGWLKQNDGPIWRPQTVRTVENDLTCTLPTLCEETSSLQTDS